MLFRSSKTLLEGELLNAIWAADASVDALIQYRYSLPSLFKRSMYLVPNELVLEVVKILEEHLTVKRPALVKKWADEEYEGAIAQAETSLGPLFNRADYLSKEAAIASFTYSYQWVEFGVSQALKKLDITIATREAEKQEKMWLDASEGMRSLLRASMADLVTSMVGKLQPTTSDGRKRGFRKDATKNIQDFIETFKARDLTEDGELQALVTKVKALADGIDPELIKSDDALRAQVQQSFEAVKVELDRLVIEAPSRHIVLED